nr:immunoglobulin heavy chain junction region [Macaca mulatta]MOY22412.1 immunoglobulin heavy chain junction region [Macaca mulatta]MOY23923.1 immunoglobulin heavy chain junction region [Macaca mulatta]MOY26346.1 immunoglobulin heavy chain junction region [Macaca mulatta]MOY29574.1 immunoglobulin heavy chain junction region [Macaca mulatta]
CARGGIVAGQPDYW